MMTRRKKRTRSKLKKKILTPTSGRVASRYRCACGLKLRPAWVFWKGRHLAHRAFSIQNQCLTLSESHPNSQSDRCSLIDFQGGGFRDVGSEPRAELCQVVGENRGLVAGTRDGDVGEARVEQVWMNFGIGMDEDAFGGKALGAGAGDGVAVVEMTMLAGVEVNLAVVVEPCCEPTIAMDRLDGREVAIGNTKRFVRGGELHAVAYGELTVDLLVDADACKAAGIVGRKLSVRFFDRKLVWGWVDRYD